MKIKYIGFKEATGYGIAASLLVKALRMADVEVHFTEILPGVPEKGGYPVSEESEDRDFDFVIIHTVPEYYPYWITEEKARNKNVSVWGYTTWETDRLPNHWPHLLNQMDGLFVPSFWNKQIFQQAVTIPVEVLPHISQFEGESVVRVENEKLRGIIEHAADDFLFYNIGAWSERKAPWLLIQAFDEEFSEKERVSLILKTGNRDWTNYKRRIKNMLRKDWGRAEEAFNKVRANLKNHAKIFHLTDELSDSDIAFLHSKSHCFVSATRGEGWGMGAYEAAWYGNPVIIPRFGGVLDFLNADYSYFLDCTLQPVATTYGKESYSQNQLWATTSISSIRKALRSVFEKKGEATLKGKILQKEVQQKFMTQGIAQKCIQLLQRASSGSLSHKLQYPV